MGVSCCLATAAVREEKAERKEDRKFKNGQKDGGFEISHKTKNLIVISWKKRISSLLSAQGGFVSVYVFSFSAVYYMDSKG